MSGPRSRLDSEVISDSEIEARLDAKPLAERRRMQTLIQIQQTEAYRRRNARALERLQTRARQITESIMRTEFAETEHV